MMKSKQFNNAGQVCNFCNGNKIKIVSITTITHGYSFSYGYVLFYEEV